MLFLRLTLFSVPALDNAAARKACNVMGVPIPPKLGGGIRSTPIGSEKDKKTPVPSKKKTRTDRRCSHFRLRIEGD